MLFNLACRCNSNQTDNRFGPEIGLNFGPGIGPISLDDVGCRGDETSLDDCSHSGIGIHNQGRIQGSLGTRPNQGGDRFQYPEILDLPLTTVIIWRMQEWSVPRKVDRHICCIIEVPILSQ